MKIVFFGQPLERPRSAHHARVLFSLLEGVVDRGHHVVYFEPEGEPHGNTYPFLNFVRYADWTSARDAVEAELVDASAVVVLSGFPGGHAATEWLLERNVPAHAYYELDPWETLGAFDSEGAAPWIRADQIAAFDIVFSLAGGPAVEAFRDRWAAEEVVTLYETIDTAVFHPRQVVEDVACDLLLVGDRAPSVEAAVETFLLETARARPSDRFLIAGAGWDGASSSWPENVELVESGGAEWRATLFSSARLVLVPVGPGSIDYAMPIELLEPAACGAACAVVDRPGLTDFFKPGDELVVPQSGADLVPYLSRNGDGDLLRLGNLAEKRVLKDYFKLRTATKFEQRLARQYFRGHNG
jgi:spore maturation protein CgeB